MDELCRWNNGATVPLLAVHGFTGGAQDFTWLANQDEAHEWWALDLPGSEQRRGLARPLGLELFLGEIEQARERIVRDTGQAPALLGYSMGGRLALHAAAQNPDHWRALVTIGATPGIDEEAQRSARRQADAELAKRMRRQTIEDFLAEWQLKPIIRSQENIRPEIRNLMIERRLKNHPRVLARVLEALSPGKLPSLWNRLDRLTMPCLFVAGENDATFAEIARRMASAVPRGKVAIIADAGHCTHLEQPAPFLEILRHFLSE